MQSPLEYTLAGIARSKTGLLGHPLVCCKIRQRQQQLGADSMTKSCPVGCDKQVLSKNIQTYLMFLARFYLYLLTYSNLKLFIYEKTTINILGFYLL